MSDEMKTRITQITVLPDGDTIFGDTATKVGIDDEGSGEFVIVAQIGRADLVVSKTAIDVGEWPALRAAINRMIRECQA